MKEPRVNRDVMFIAPRWEWEVQVPELDASVFMMSGQRVMSREDTLVVLNMIALAVINEIRGVNPEYVFTYKGIPLTRMYNRAWKKAR